MKMARLLILVSCLLLVACNKSDDSLPTPPAGTPTPNGSGSALPGEKTGSSTTSSGPTSTASSGTPVASFGVEVGNGMAKIDASNSTIQFIGTHVGAEPNPRTGQFGEFEGKIAVDGDKPTSIELEIQTDSLVVDPGTQLNAPMQGKLTTHLKSAEFLDGRQFPTATFKSKSITASEGTDAAKTYNVAGDLTLHGETKEISFPVSAKVADNQLAMTGTFTINRSDFKINFNPQMVE